MNDNRRSGIKNKLKDPSLFAEVKSLLVSWLVIIANDEAIPDRAELFMEIVEALKKPAKGGTTP